MPKPSNGDNKTQKGNQWRVQICERLVELFRTRCSDKWVFVWYEKGGKLSYDSNRSRFSKQQNTMEKRFSGEAGLTKWLCLFNKNGGDKIEIMCDIVFRDKPLTHAIHKSIQLKVPAGNTGVKWPTPQQGVELCKGRWVMQVWGRLSADRWDVVEVNDLRLIPMWRLPVAMFSVPATGTDKKDPTKTIVNVEGVSELVEPWHPWDLSKPGNMAAGSLGLRAPAYIYIPTRVAKIVKEEGAK
jgi:hypothetical protein